LPRFRARVEVRLQADVNDPPGNTVADGLLQLGFDGVRSVRIGKLIEIDLEAADAEAALADAEAMAGRLLANPVIEDYAVRVQALELR
jgi:phosphoribosylformylglycinamidine synthase